MKACGLLLLGACLASAATPKVPLEDFFGEPSIRSVLIAPDGAHVAFLKPGAGGRVGIGILDLATGVPEILARPSDENVRVLYWKGPRKLVFGADVGGNESYALLTIDIQTGSITRLSDSYEIGVSDDAATAGVIDSLPLSPNHMLMEGMNSVADVGQLGNGTAGSTYGVFLINIENGHREFEFTRPFGYGGLLDDDLGEYTADNTGLVRFKVVKSKPDYLVEYRPDAHTAYRVVAHTPPDEVISDWETYGFNADNRTAYVGTKAPGGTALYAFDTATLQLGDPLVTLPPGELKGPLLSTDRTRLTGVAGEGEKSYYRFLDAGRAALQQAIDHAFPATLNTIRSASDDEKRLIILCRSDREPGAYYLMDRTSHRIMPLGRVLPKINPAQMAVMQPITYRARDGLTIHGYLTLPLDRKPGERVPLVLHPHGGPYGPRDSWGFDPEVQLLANRGYAVLQVNYRGSGGYGAKFAEAGRYEWGGKMTDDLTDAVHWAIDQGYADPKRMAVFGASYGGYCALACAAFTPDLYRCAINYVGPGDLVALSNTKDFRRYGLRDFYRHWLPADKATLAARSPTLHVENIKIPTLHAYGENDPRVDISQWHELRRELDRYGKKYEFFDMANEGHGFHNESARLTFYRRVESFLAENLQ